VKTKGSAPDLRWISTSIMSLSALTLAGCAHIGDAPTPPDQIDAVVAAPALFKVLLENEHVRVIEYQLAPGEKDAPHTHPPKVSYILSGGRLRIYPATGEPFESNEVAGLASWDDARPWHYVENIGETPVRILLVEPK
jgi:quercetin dioxygenase-like cupin family protein